jgi:hypothetical protein
VKAGQFTGQRICQVVAYTDRDICDGSLRLLVPHLLSRHELKESRQAPRCRAEARLYEGPRRAQDGFRRGALQGGTPARPRWAAKHKKMCPAEAGLYEGHAWRGRSMVFVEAPFRAARLRVSNRRRSSAKQDVPGSRLYRDEFRRPLRRARPARAQHGFRRGVLQGGTPVSRKRAAKRRKRRDARLKPASTKGLAEVNLGGTQDGLRRGALQGGMPASLRVADGRPTARDDVPG